MLFLAPRMLRMENKKQYVKFLKFVGVVSVVGLVIMFTSLLLLNPEIAEQKIIIKNESKYINNYFINNSDFSGASLLSLSSSSSSSSSSSL